MENNKITEELESMDIKELERLLDTVRSEYLGRIEEKTHALKEGDIIKRPGNHGTIFDLIIDIRDEYIDDNYYEWIVEYATYFVDDNGKVYYRDLRTYNLDESYKVFELTRPDVEIIHSNYEPGCYQKRLDDLMVDIFNEAMERSK